MYVNKARSMAAECDGIFLDQFENDRNWRVHFASTGPEIYDQCAGSLTVFVSGAGTCGTLAGVSRYLKSVDPSIKAVLADPQGSVLFNAVRYGVLHAKEHNEGTRRRMQVDSLVEGIGLGRSTANFRVAQEIVDDAVRVSDAEAMRMTRWVRDHDGLLVGGSSGVNLVAAARLAQDMSAKGINGRIVTILCDGGERHISKFWKDDFSVASFDEVLDKDWDDGLLLFQSQAPQAN
jgi:cysteine synthase A